MGDKRGKRAGRNKTVEALLAAAEELFSQRGYTAVTVREIAAAAGVSHALAHRYLGSKEEIYRAVLRRHETTIRDSAAGEEELLEATAMMLRTAWTQQVAYLRLIIHSALHGLPYERTSGRFAATERLVELAEQTATAGGEPRPAGDPEPRFVIASIVAMLLGWAAVKDWLLPAAGLGELSDEEFLAALERVILDTERLYFPVPQPPRDS